MALLLVLPSCGSEYEVTRTDSEYSIKAELLDGELSTEYSLCAEDRIDVELSISRASVRREIFLGDDSIYSDNGELEAYAVYVPTDGEDTIFVESNDAVGTMSFVIDR